jgi:hypothetical protein
MDASGREMGNAGCQTRAQSRVYSAQDADSTDIEHLALGACPPDVPYEPGPVLRKLRCSVMATWSADGLGEEARRVARNSDYTCEWFPALTPQPERSSGNCRIAPGTWPSSKFILHAGRHLAMPLDGDRWPEPLIATDADQPAPDRVEGWDLIPAATISRTFRRSSRDEETQSRSHPQTARFGQVVVPCAAALGNLNAGHGFWRQGWMLNCHRVVDRPPRRIRSARDEGWSNIPPK